MKRRNFLKAIGLGALVAPAVVMAKSEQSSIVIKPRSMGMSSSLDMAMHKTFIRDNPYSAAIAQNINNGDMLMIDSQTGLLTKWEAIKLIE